jgi:hypothetical protein
MCPHDNATYALDLSTTTAGSDDLFLLFMCNTCSWRSDILVRAQVFPHVRHLVISSMQRLTAIVGLEALQQLTALELRDCPRMVHSEQREMAALLALSTSLQLLHFKDCPGLKAICCCSTQLHTMCIVRCPSLKEISVQGVHNTMQLHCSGELRSQLKGLTQLCMLEHISVQLSKGAGDLRECSSAADKLAGPGAAAPGQVFGYSGYGPIGLRSVWDVEITRAREQDVDVIHPLTQRISELHPWVQVYFDEIGSTEDAECETEWNISEAAAWNAWKEVCVGKL